MSRRGWLGAAGAAGGLSAAAFGAALVVERRVAGKRRAGASGADRLGGLHSTPVRVSADDGVLLYAEVDEPAPYPAGDPGSAARDAARPRITHGSTSHEARLNEVTVVFVHGYALNLDCWHFQREHLRGRRRLVFYDQRSHGRSERSSDENATIDQLGRDLLSVLDQLAPDGPVVLVGHSMGGMTIIALAEQHPELFGDRVVGVALMSTTAGGLHTHRLLGPLVPERVGGRVGPRLVAGLARAPGLVDSVRRRGSNLGYLVTDWFAFGEEVPASYVEFVDEMLAGTPFEVLAQFFPQFDALDKFSVLAALERVPTTVVSGTKDLLTSVGHSRKLAERITGSRLVECEGAGHMVILERKDRVNAALDELLAAADEARASRAS